MKGYEKLKLLRILKFQILLF